MSNAFQTITAIGLAIIGLAALAVFLGQRSQTTQVIQASTSGLAALLNAALSPVSSTAGGITQ